MSPRREDDQRSAPTPESVHALAREIVKHADHLPDLYLSPYDMAYGRTVSGAEGKTAIWESDPTKNVALSKEKRRLRQDLHNSVEMMKDVLGTLRAIETKVTKSTERAYGVLTWAETLRMQRGERDQAFPRTATKEELAAAAEAQRKREERGEAS